MSEVDPSIPQLTEEQIDAITSRRLESLIGSDWIPPHIYRAISFITVRFTVELALVKPSMDGPEVLLTQREPDDPDIPNQWHIPGVGVRPTDPVQHYHDNAPALARIMTDEVGGDIQIAHKPIALDFVRRVGGGRTEVTAQYWTKVVGGDQENGKFFNIAAVLKQPPLEGLVTTHDDTIKKVADHYARYNGHGNW